MKNFCRSRVSMDTTSPVHSHRRLLLCLSHVGFVLSDRRCIGCIPSLNSQNAKFNWRSNHATLCNCALLICSKMFYVRLFTRWSDSRLQNDRSDPSGVSFPLAVNRSPLSHDLTAATHRPEKIPHIETRGTFFFRLLSSARVFPSVAWH